MAHGFAEMKSYVGFDAADEDRLRRFWPVLAPHVEGVIDHFYAKILASPGARSVLANKDQVERLKWTLRGWLEEALLGPWDESYVVKRERIGSRHVEVGLHSRYMFTAMSVILQDVADVARRFLGTQDAIAVTDSLQRAFHLDLAIMTGTFVMGRERRQLETLQALLVGHLRTVVLLVAADGRVTAATRPTSELFGCGSVIGRPWLEAVPGTLVAAGELVERVARARSTAREISLPRVDVDEEGRCRSFRVHVVPLEHELASFLIQVEELTDAVALEGRLRRSEALAQLGALSAAVAHELRNPLAGISGALQVIGRSLPEDAPHRGIMVKVEQEVHRLNGLVTDLLAFAKPGSVRLQVLDLSAAVDGAIDLIRDDWPSVRFARQGEGLARADANLTRQILLNLLFNAAQAVNGDGDVRVLVGPGRLVVADSGPGVPEAQWQEIFKPFFTTKTRGTGLGLAICSRSAMAMQARLGLVPAVPPFTGAAFQLDMAPAQ